MTRVVLKPFLASSLAMTSLVVPFLSRQKTLVCDNFQCIEPHTTTDLAGIQKYVSDSPHYASDKCELQSVKFGR